MRTWLSSHEHTHISVCGGEQYTGTRSTDGRYYFDLPIYARQEAITVGLEPSGPPPDHVESEPRDEDKSLSETFNSEDNREKQLEDGDDLDKAELKKAFDKLAKTGDLKKAAEDDDAADKDGASGDDTTDENDQSGEEPEQDDPATDERG